MLKFEGLIKRERCGKNVWYSLTSSGRIMASKDFAKDDTSVLASVLAVALKFSHSVLNPHIPQQMYLYRCLFPWISIVFIGFFYGLYMRKVLDGETVDLRAIFLRILKFVAVFGVYSAAWLTLEIIAKRYHISFPVSFTVSAMLGIIFIVIVYLLINLSSQNLHEGCILPVLCG